VEGRSILEAWLPTDDPVVEWAERHLPALSRGLLGTLFLLVSTLTIERWDSYFPVSINDLKMTTWLSRCLYWLYSPHPSPPSPVSKLDCDTQEDRRKRDNLLTGEEGVGGGGAISYVGEKA
jgi:hypothetical protein